MFYVYILLRNDKKLYTGYTSDLKRRMVEHTKAKVASTRKYLPVKLIHYEAYQLESDARRRERYLKTTEGKYFSRQQIRDFMGSTQLL